MTSIRWEKAMRIAALKPIAALAILAAAEVLTAAPAPAQTYGGSYPVCIQRYRWGGSDVDCSYTSFAQCAATASGLSATCLENPYFARAQMPAGPASPRYR
jgi:hypothetical protein